VCGLHYSLVDADDVERVHPRHHRRFRDLQARHGVQNGAGRELDKSRGYDLLRSSELQERVQGAVLILRAWYHRYLLNHDDEPTFLTWVSGFDLEREFSWADGVVPELRNLYPRRNPEA
jgi:hypothetical protein